MTDLFTNGRMTSGLEEVKNDTGRVAFCGPYVLSAITGWYITARFKASGSQPPDPAF